MAFKGLFGAIGRGIVVAGAGMGIASPVISSAYAKVSSVQPIAGQPDLMLGATRFDAVGYDIREFAIAGTANSYQLVGEASEDGRWRATVSGSAPYRTRVVVLRPSDQRKFNGTVLVEWSNVSGGLDVPVLWTAAHRELLRSGYAVMAVSAQRVGVEGGPSITGGAAPRGLKQTSPQRYADLSHPGDAFSFDIFSDVGSVAKTSPSQLFGPLVPRRLIAGGQSQSAFFLTTYINAVDPIAKVYDGYLVQGRGATAAQLDGSRVDITSAKIARFRPDLRVPVLTLTPESDLMGLFGPQGGYVRARMPDHPKLRVWELAGAAHSDNYSYRVGQIDTKSTPLAEIAAAYAPMQEASGQRMAKPMNFGPQQHYVTQAAIDQLNRWIITGKAPPRAPVLVVSDGEPRQLIRDKRGLAIGGLRTPWVDVPTAVLSGQGNSGSQRAAIVGTAEFFDQKTLDDLYPGGKAEYLRKFTVSLDRSINAGYILRSDRAEILALAALLYPGNR